MTQDVKQTMDGCLPCQASVTSTMSSPMDIRETPEDVFQHSCVDFKGPIGGEYCLHVLIYKLSRYPLVQFVKSTKFIDLRPKLDNLFSMFRVPDSVTHDGCLPCNTQYWKDYTKEQGFESRLCMPEHPEAGAEN